MYSKLIGFDTDNCTQDKAIATTAGPELPATWKGLAAYLNYAFNEQWKSSVRIEYFDDEQGYRTGVRQTWRELTATIAYLPVKSIELRGEFRIDGSDAKAFQSASSNPASDQQSLSLEALFKY